MTGKVFEELERARGTTGSGRRMTLADAAKRSAEEAPAFAEALRAEEEHRTACRELRGRLKAARTDQKVTQAELARRLGMSQSAVARLESGSGDIGFLTMRRYLAALDLEPSVVFARTAGTSGVRASEGASGNQQTRGATLLRQVAPGRWEASPIPPRHLPRTEEDASGEADKGEATLGDKFDYEDLVVAIETASGALKRAHEVLIRDAHSPHAEIEDDRPDHDGETAGGSR